jgi:aldose 1-epimerase
MSRLIACGLASAIVVALFAPYSQAQVHAFDFGKTKNGEEVKIYEISNPAGMIAKIMTRGATLVSLTVPDLDGKLADVVFGFDDVAGYESKDNGYFGATVGRYANRIAKGKFTLDGKEYQLATNDGPNHLHGGKDRSFDKVVWKARRFEGDGQRGVKFSYTSPDGEEGYPGTLEATVAYTLTDKNELRIEYEAKTDKPTIINLTNHSYFNLGGAGSPTVNNHVLRIYADKYTPVDDTLIPTGEIADVEGTPLDFRKATPIGQRVEKLTNTSAKGYDHNFVLNPPKRGEDKIRKAAELVDPSSGRKLTVYTDQPGVQFYGGNFLNGVKGKNGQTYAHRSACCLETQVFPDSPNKQGVEGWTNCVLRPDETYKHTCIYAFGVKDMADKAKKTK